MWTWFDTCIIVISVVDNLILSPMPGQFIIMRRLDESVQQEGSPIQDETADADDRNSPNSVCRPMFM